MYIISLGWLLYHFDAPLFVQIAFYACAIFRCFVVKEL